MANPPMTDNDIAAVVQAAVIGERERCAKIVETYALDKLNHIANSRVILAAVIRNEE